MAERNHTMADDLLSSYRAKRSLDRTPEPAGGEPAPGGRLFVVHKHAARNLHFDLRLEMEGVLRSWAVPRGFSADPRDKKLAVRVEDHPIEYGDFEGLIPEGNYGAGAVIVWDRGEWIALEDPMDGLEKGKLLFEFRGYKLKGKWTLVKIKKSQKEWLLIKERDGYVVPGGGEYPEESVLSGIRVEDLKAGEDFARPVREALLKLKAPRRKVAAPDVGMMLSETREKPFTRAGWVFELKLDGYRLVSGSEKGRAQLISRNGIDLAGTFPEVTRAMAALPFGNIVLDGEVVAMTPDGRPSFQLLQQRGKLTRAPDVARAAVEIPVTYFAFDLLGFEDFDLRGLPLVKRKELLQKVLPPVGAVRYLEHFNADGESLYQQVVELGLEGIMAKKADSKYQAGRSPHWNKIRADRTDDFVVVGFSQPKGSRGGFGALHLGQYVDSKLAYSGRAGSGFSSKQLKEVKAELDRITRPDPPCIGPIPSGARTGTIPITGVPDYRTARWVEPRLVCEVRFKEWTQEGYLRHPVFLRFRDDKPADECIRQEPTAAAAESEPKKPPQITPEPARVQLSNVDKIFWPDDGYTKGDLIEYYRSIAPWLLPYLHDRPVVLTRFPDGINGKSFFQKDAPGFVPDWLRTVRMYSDQAARDIDYFVCENEAGLTYLANMAAIPLHIWASRVATLEHPDWCSLDLDPKGAPFSDVITLARAARELCERIELPCFIKTTGSSGLHVMIPLGRQFTHDQARTMGEVLAHALVRHHAGIATTTRQVQKREGKVYVDYLQNGHGKLLVAPFSVRPLPGAPVSMPLKWTEVKPGLDIRAFTIKNAIARMKKLKQDPLLPILDIAPDLAAVLDSLQREL